ncbi:hypothetical protein K493DRAFT_295664 [Basidiobolus meristosporus CBS 931.73]|uniref:Uncharacterized protein n=1 Tax=Basidiobolus meristosporus CBS 931.73 TaxID=1314790 RepID=A0A1Y1Z9Z2_9FUNG|nr:hypothetical protein K493DRAFT_295664 [Basidiobolus meristosporus CBS 931.73]|eukprot:ORY07090.1 hypothetical protein K493DRAFT_295664 [Basidiobolus meristosporus CBS 931.73]
MSFFSVFGECYPAEPTEGLGLFAEERKPRMRKPRKLSLPDLEATRDQWNVKARATRRKLSELLPNRPIPEEKEEGYVVDYSDNLETMRDKLRETPFDQLIRPNKRKEEIATVKFTLTPSLAR